MSKYIKINPADNVAVAVEDLFAGEQLNIDGEIIVLQNDITAGHKIALRDFSPDDNVIKYGLPIGHASETIVRGALINEKNIKTNLEGILDYSYNPSPAPVLKPEKQLTFKGYRRKNGDAGIRNEIWIIPTVGCVNGIINELAKSLR